MRFTAAIGCWIVAIECAAKATGSEPQQMFAADTIWVWWFAALFWGTSGMRVLLSGAQ